MLQQLELIAKLGDIEVFSLSANTVKFEALKTSCDFACAVKLYSNPSLHIIICLYNPPRGSQYRVDWTTIHATIQHLIPTHDFKIIITADFNKPNVDWNSFRTTNADFEVLPDSFIQYSMHQLISPPLILRPIYLRLTYFCLR